MTELFAPAIAALKAHQGDLLSIPGVVGVRPGFQRVSGQLMQTPAIIIVTLPDTPVGGIPSALDGIPVETRVASALELVEGVGPLAAWEGIAPEAAPAINYRPPDPSEVALVEMQVHDITCHVGPDSGWENLKPFLEGTSSTLTVAMYDLYAPHVIDLLKQLGENEQLKLDLILDVTPNDTQTEQALRESWGNRLNFVRASVSGPNRIFNTAYHTKVAVRDSKAFWLSSGNWTPTSQPEIAPGSEHNLYAKGNREWHVIIKDAPLAQMYEKFIRYDMREAAAAGLPETAPVMPDLLIPQTFLFNELATVQDHPFVAKTFATRGEPVRVKPLMSPDNYASEILNLINSAEHSLYLQFSYIRQPATEKFDQIIRAITAKMNAGLDVRVLVDRRNQEQAHTDMLLGVHGWSPQMLRRQTSKSHNKGVLVDGKVAVVGSNNWSSSGTQYNRDTSLVFFSRPIAEYFTEIFMFDWDNLSRPSTDAPEPPPQIAPETGPTPLGMIRIPWRAWFED